MGFMKNFKKHLTVILAVVMILTAIPAGASVPDQYGRKGGLPLPASVKLPERVMQNQGFPGDDQHPGWDGYYRIYYFQAPEEWLEHPEYKEEGFDIGLYWYYGFESCGQWPGIPAKKLASRGNIYYAVVPSYVNNIIWNNGINGGLPTNPGYNHEKAQAAFQTVDLNVEDGYFNQLEIDDLCGCLCIPEKPYVSESSFTGEPLRYCMADWVYFDPRSGNISELPLIMDGAPLYDENGFPMNPYYDMDYSRTPNKVDFTVNDVLQIQEYLAAVAEARGYTTDADLDGKITIYDALLIQKIIAKICV